MIFSNLFFLSESLKIVFLNRSLSIFLSLSKYCSPNSFINNSYPFEFLFSTFLARSSASIKSTPSSTKKLAAADFPEPMPAGDLIRQIWLDAKKILSE